MSASTVTDSVVSDRFAAVARRVLEEHRAFLVLSATYIALGGAILLRLNRPWPIRLISPATANFWLAGSLAGLTCQYFLSGRPPFRTWMSPGRFAGAILVALLLDPLQITFQSLKQSIGPLIGFQWDERLSRIDAALHGGRPAWTWGEPLIASLHTRQLLDLAYIFWFPFVLAFVIWASWARDRALRRRTLLTFLTTWIVGGTICAALLSSAGPAYLPQYARLTAYISGTMAATNQAGLWKSFEAHQWIPLGGISAMPSMHVAVAVVMALVLSRRNRTLGVCAWVYAGVIQVASVLLGWHYAVDGYAGAAIAYGCWRATAPRSARTA